MSNAYLRNTVFLLIGAFLLTGMAVVTMFLPLIGVIGDLTAGENSGSTAGISTAGIIASVAALAMSLLTMALTIYGLIRDRSRRWVWVLMLVVGIIILVHAALLAFVAPKFAGLYNDLRR